MDTSHMNHHHNNNNNSNNALSLSGASSPSAAQSTSSMVTLGGQSTTPPLPPLPPLPLCPLETATNHNATLLAALRPLDAVGLSTGGPKTLDDYMSHLIATHRLEDNFYVCDLAQVTRCHAAWSSALPRVHPYYAVKCHPNQGVVSVLAALGANFDCASPGEIDLVTSLGVAPDRIIYANPCKRPSDLRFARKMNIRMATFDTVSELDKVAMYYPEMDMVLRIRADDPGARCQLGNKFGAEEENWTELLDAARERRVSVVGVSFHVGSGASSGAAFERAIAGSRRVFDLARERGFALTLLDIGGGFTAQLDEFGQVNLGTMPNAVNLALDMHFPSSLGVKVISEPGRFFVEKACTMATQVFGRRPRHYPDGGVEMHYWITDGLYGSMNCVIYDHATLRPSALKAPGNHHLHSHSHHHHTSGPNVIVHDKSVNHTLSSSLMDGYEEDEELYATTLFGPTCDGLDTVVRDIQFPLLQNGDWVVFRDMGAYTIAGATDFNGIKVCSAKFFYVYSQTRTLNDE